MDLLPSADQNQIIDVVRAFLAERFPTSRLRERADERSSFPAESWGECAELGWFALGLPEVAGGAGLGVADEALVFREIGRHLVPGPFLATSLAAHVAMVAGQPALVAGIASGSMPVALASPRGDLPQLGDLIDGSFHVIDGPDATHVLIVTDRAVALVASGVAGETETVPCIDEGVRLGRLAMEGVPTLVRLSGDDAHEIWLRGTVLGAGMLTGIAEATRDQAAHYAKDRIQFGRPIGTNQAIKHTCADMALRAEAAYSQLVVAALSVHEGHPDRARQVASVRLVATDAAIANASANVQVHGGIGFTHEHDANLYVKRARVLDRMLGGKRPCLDHLLAATAAR